MSKHKQRKQSSTQHHSSSSSKQKGDAVSEALKVLAHRLCFVSSGAGLVSSYTRAFAHTHKHVIRAVRRRSDRACSLEHRFIQMSTSICDGVTSALVSITSPRSARGVVVGGRGEGGRNGGSGGRTVRLRLGRQRVLSVKRRHLAAPAPLKVCDVLSIIIDGRRPRSTYVSPQTREGRWGRVARLRLGRQSGLVM
jgi:hypothetical protein